MENTATTGSIETTDARKRELAYRSIEFNLSNPKFVKLFPELSETLEQVCVVCAMWAQP